MLSAVCLTGRLLMRLYGLDDLSCGCGTDCGLSKYEVIEGLITSPGYPDMYPNDLKCGYNISSLSPSYAYSTVTIIFDELDMEFHDKCDYDFVLVSGCKSNNEYMQILANYKHRDRT